MCDMGTGKKPLQSASAIVAGTESGQHVLKISGYSRTKDEVPTGSCISSRSFRVGGHSWHIKYYPNGLKSTSAEYISLVLQREDDVPQEVRAQYGFSLLDHGGKPVQQYTTRDKFQIFLGVTWWGFPFFIERDALEKSEHLRDDGFTIRCDLTVAKKIHTMDIDGATPQPPPAVVVPPSDLHRHLGGLLATGAGADVTFEVDGKKFPAHRLVLAARSPALLRAAELANMETDVARIEDMEAQDFEAFLHYVYTDTLPPATSTGNKDAAAAAAAAMLPDLIAAANRYEMERLRLVCEDKLCELLNARNVAAVLAFAGEHRCHGLKEACLRFLKDPANLREVVKGNGLEHLSGSCPSVLQDLIAMLVAGLPA